MTIVRLLFDEVTQLAYVDFGACTMISATKSCEGLNPSYASLFKVAKQAGEQHFSSIIQQGEESIIYCATVNPLEMEEAN